MNVRAPQTTTKLTKPPKAHVRDSGHKLSESEPVAEKEDPREAARRAAEERYDATRSQSGVLGKKLDEERKKSHLTHLKEHSEQQYNEKRTIELNYD